MFKNSASVLAGLMAFGFISIFYASPAHAVKGCWKGNGSFKQYRGQCRVYGRRNTVVCVVNGSRIVERLSRRGFARWQLGGYNGTFKVAKNGRRATVCVRTNKGRKCKSSRMRKFRC